jgi:hypothetical protein
MNEFVPATGVLVILIQQLLDRPHLNWSGEVFDYSFPRDEVHVWKLRTV